jgi:hypothetical protein
MRLLQIGHPSAIRYMKQAEEQGISRGVSQAEQCHVSAIVLPISTNPEFGRIFGCSHGKKSREIFYPTRCPGPTKCTIEEI